MTIDEAREQVGHKVVYRAPHLASDSPGEEGVITSVSDSYAYVRYGADVHSKATYPALLEAVS
ncbi:hypothetical protein [Mycolicibacter kumamotonensis]|uniref:Uncharacterized protein n=1 Tax=Mycolicibacter kumamotonensis TaxID=354243 RepID=A0A1B8SL63_9MYCO|nr:hypothetical protein [Mycolicibacter kumamotonensis]OBY33506.1 hypothetical protein ACT18_00755 [Mycolicibacter kumamotonensis]